MVFTGVSAFGRGLQPITPPGGFVSPTGVGARSAVSAVPPVSFGNYRAPNSGTTATAPAAPSSSQTNWLSDILSGLSANTIPPVQPVKFGGSSGSDTASTEVPAEKPASDSKAPADGKESAKTPGSNPNEDGPVQQSREDNCGPTAVAMAAGKDAEQVTSESENDGSYQAGAGSTVDGVQQQLSKATGKDAKIDNDTSQENIAKKAQQGPTVVTVITPEGGGHVVTANKDGTFNDPNGQKRTYEQMVNEGFQFDNVVTTAA
jgi:hypothetical protein